MVIAAGILMFALSVFVVAYPLFTKTAQPPPASSRSAGASSGEHLAELLAHRDATYVTLKELELDHEMGKLSSSDYQALRDQYRAQAVAILQELDARQAKARVQASEERALEPEKREVEREIEREIAARRRRRRRDPARCPGCRAAFEPGDRFCRRCGAALEKESA